MGVRARKIPPVQAPDRYASEQAEGAPLHPREVLETLETHAYVDDDIGAARGIANATIIGAVVWASIIVTYSLLR